MRADPFDEAAFYRSVADSGTRALLIGRRALVALGYPVVTSDYDFWIHIDDIARLNAAVAPFGLIPNHPPEEARRRGRYVLENSEHVDVLIARSVPTIDGVRVVFDEIWERRRVVYLGDGVPVTLPDIDDLIATKKFGARPRDAEDIRTLETLRGKLT